LLDQWDMASGFFRIGTAPVIGGILPIAFLDTQTLFASRTLLIHQLQYGDFMQPYPPLQTKAYTNDAIFYEGDCCYADALNEIYTRDNPFGTYSQNMFRRRKSFVVGSVGINGYQPDFASPTGYWDKITWQYTVADSTEAVDLINTARISY